MIDPIIPTPVRLMAASLLLATTVQSICECGFIDETGAIWQEALVIPFAKVSDFPSLPDWTATSHTVRAPTNGVAHTFLPTNVRLPANSSLSLTMPSPQNSTTNSTLLSCAEIRTARTDILYGSFRATFKTPAPAGAVAAFFFYANDTAEFDVEILTRESRRVHLTVQPVGYLADGVTEDPATTVSKALDETPSDGFHEYRMDWHPSSVSFLTDANLTSTLSVNVPSVNGSLMLNLWGNANPAWTGPAPDRDAVMEVRDTVFFFNSSDPATVTMDVGRCARAAAVGTATDPTVCPVARVRTDLLYGATAKGRGEAPVLLPLPSPKESASLSQALVTWWTWAGVAVAAVVGIVG
ncbi:hypothetical protein HKX48_004740 [Thoreauomyces humboldtii]|nr:hypothetical protein HKX48_004740 [Thoreauomyces humboldtii]